ncbi:hypothetical protein ACFPYI_07705 [Halomarina salina]|uniref:Integral membrane protein n=1 Tax=Halomarina salina TaxID=1872699 RepID=A0ABD5RLD1_9EURY|nr:hypothetical protein [Halomarina salina]
MNGSLYDRSTIVTVLCTLGVLVVMRRALERFVGGEPLGDELSMLVVGTLVLVSIAGFRVADWTKGNGHLTDRQDRVALLSLLGVVIGGCVAVLYYLPHAPEAIGVLIVAVPGALILLRDTFSGRAPSR